MIKVDYNNYFSFRKLLNSLCQRKYPNKTCWWDYPIDDSTNYVCCICDCYMDHGDEKTFMEIFFEHATQHVNEHKELVAFL